MGNKPIVHAPIATGSTEPRDIRDRFADFVNLKDFGAKGDGVTDDSTAWTAWKTACKNNKSMGLIPAGDYVLGETGAHFPYGMIYHNIAANSSYEDDWPVFNSHFQQDIYVSASGNDNNDGLTENTPVRTINRALTICTTLPKPLQSVRLFIDGGTYNEGQIYLQGYTCYFYLRGNVTINGYLSLVTHRLFIQKDPNTADTVTLTLNITQSAANPLSINSKSYMQITGVNFKIIANSTSLEHIVYLAANSVLSINNSSFEIELDKSITNYMFLIQGISRLYISSAILVTSNNNATSLGAIYVNMNSVCEIYSTIVFNENIVLGTFLTVSNSSIALVDGTNKNTSIFKNHSQTSDYYVVFVSTNSLAKIYNITIEGSRSATGKEFYSVYGGSTLEFTNIITTVKTSVGAIYSASTGGIMQFNGTVTTNGSCTINTTALLGSYIRIPSNTTLNGTVTGKRFNVSRCSVINVSGGGANKIPGTIAGTVDTATYGAYA